MAEINSEDVVYSDGVLSVTWTATPTDPVQMDEEYGTAYRISTFRKDFIGHTAELGTLPKKGATITRTNGEVYKVVGDGPEGACWNYINDVRDRIRIRTLRVEQ